MVDKERAFTEQVNLVNGTNHRATILLDLDDVCARFAEPLLALYNEKYQDSLTPADMFDWDMTKYVKESCGSDILHLMKTPGLFRQLQPYPGAQEVVGRLVENGFNILFVTDSPKGNCFSDYSGDSLLVSNPTDDKRSWVAEHFPMVPASNIIFGSLKYYVRGDLLIDDKPDTFLKFQSLGLDALLMDKPYNRHIQTDKRIYTLEEGEQAIYQAFLPRT